jgi:hypothetical protein
MMDGLPKSVRVGPHVLPFKELSGEDAKTLNGQYDNYTIQLLKAYPSGSVAVEIVLHEMTHALLTYGGVTDKSQEQICEIMGVGLTQIIRDNPELIAWMQKTVKK